MLKNVVFRLSCAFLLSVCLMHAIIGQEGRGAPRIDIFVPQEVSDEVINQRARARMIESFGHARFHNSFFELARRVERLLSRPDVQRSIFQMILAHSDRFAELRTLSTCTVLQLDTLVQVFNEVVIRMILEAVGQMMFQIIPPMSPFVMQPGFDRDKWTNKGFMIARVCCQASVVRALAQFGCNRAVLGDAASGLNCSGVAMCEDWTNSWVEDFPIIGKMCFVVVFAKMGLEEVLEYLTRPELKNCVICHRALVQPGGIVQPVYTTDGSITNSALALRECYRRMQEQDPRALLPQACHAGCYLRTPIIT